MRHYLALHSSQKEIIWNAKFTCCLYSFIHVEEKAKGEEEEKASEIEADRKQDTSEEKTDTAQNEDKPDKAPKEKSPNKGMKDSSFTERNIVYKVRDIKSEPTDSAKSKVDKKEPMEQQPKEVEGNKDPGGVNGTKPEAANEQVDAKEPDTSGDTDNSQQVQNGMCTKFLC